jgi:hypothetical protein
MPMPRADIVAIPGKEARRPTIADREHPKAVVLDLERPVVAIKRLAASLDDLKRELMRPEHAIYFPERRRSLKIAETVYTLPSPSAVGRIARRAHSQERYRSAQSQSATMSEDAESVVRLALATRRGSISTSHGEWHLFSWVGWQVSR